MVISFFAAAQDFFWFSSSKAQEPGENPHAREIF